MGNRVETAWIMAEIEPYSFESVRVRSQRKTMFTRVEMSVEEEIHRGVYASVVRTGKLRATRERMLMLQGNRGSI